eukprot:513860-Alexandrium_andersonii.AAC.1
MSSAASISPCGVEDPGCDSDRLKTEGVSKIFAVTTLRVKWGTGFPKNDFRKICEGFVLRKSVIRPPFVTAHNEVS